MPVMRLREKLFMKQTVIVIIKRKYNCRRIIKKFETSQTFFKSGIVTLVVLSVEAQHFFYTWN